jgi:hypothetical protein
MSHKPPPVPPANRSRKGSGSNPDVKTERDRAKPPKKKENAAQQGDRANIRQNTTNQGYQQDR